MVYFRFICRKVLTNPVVFKRHRYYVLLPEIPPDTPETNPLLRTHQLPLFSQITDRQCVSAVVKLLMEHETGVHQLDTKLSDPSVPKTVENVILPLDRLSNPLDFAFATFKILYTLRSSESIADAYIKLYPRVLQTKVQQYSSPSIHKAFKELAANNQNLTEPVQRIVKKHLLESRLSGYGLEDKTDHFRTVLMKLQKNKSDYRQRLNECTTKFSQPLDAADIQSFPRDFVYQIAEDRDFPERGPWNVTLAPNIYQCFMEHCENRLLRWNVWNAKHSQASSISGHKLNNSINIEEIRYSRMDQAQLLGYDSFAKMSMETKMAGSLENVHAMLTTMHVKSEAQTHREIQQLQDFAVSNGFENKLELWDVPFWQRRHKDALFGINENTVRQYFPLPKVLRGIFEFCHKLFGITIAESDKNVDTWHEDVTYYKILDGHGDQIASFFLDPYSRPEDKVSGEWMEIGRNRSDVVGSEPLSYLVFNFTPPMSGKPSLLSFKELTILMQKFAHVLQHSLTTVPYNGVAGLTNLEWDAVNICPMFMSYWLQHYNTVSKFSGHVDSGEVISKEMHDKIIKESNYMCSLKLSEELYLSALDLEFYTSKDFWMDITKRVWIEYMPFPFDKSQSHPCSFPQIFCDEYPAAYFSKLWSEMIAADVFSAFEEAGLDDIDALKAVGLRFKDTFLSVGGGCHPSEIFRRFRGRDPSTDALVHRYGLDKSPLKSLEASA